MDVTLPTALITARQNLRHASNDHAAPCLRNTSMVHHVTTLHSRYSCHTFNTNPPSAHEPSRWQCGYSDRCMLHHPGYITHKTVTVIQHETLIALTHSTSEGTGDTHVFNT